MQRYGNRNAARTTGKPAQRPQRSRRPRRHTRYLGALALLGATVLYLPGASASGRPPVPSPAPPEVEHAQPDRTWNHAFASYANSRAQHGHWTGADSTYSVPLTRSGHGGGKRGGAHGGRLWIFSDTYLGTIRPDDSRSSKTPFLHNTFLRQDATGLHTVTGHRGHDRPDSLVNSRKPHRRYWARAAQRTRHGVDVIYGRYRRTGPGSLDIVWERNVLASFDTDQLSRPRSVTPLPSSSHIAWGAWLRRSHGHTYVYGTEQTHSGGARLHLARTNGTSLGTRWLYRTADGHWSPSESRSAPLTRRGGGAKGSLRVSEELSVVRHGQWYALLSQAQKPAFSPEMQVSWSRSPAGPFTRPRTIFKAPEAGAAGTYRNKNVYAYNPHEHPDLEHRGELVFSYNVNSLHPRDLHHHASIYRPRFVRAHLTPPAGGRR